MIWKICLILSVGAIIISVLAIHALAMKGKIRSKRSLVYYFGGGFFLASTIIFYPIYASVFEGDPMCVVKSILLSLHNTIRLFIVDGEFTFVLEYADQMEGLLYQAYTLWAALFFLTAPLLTFGFVLSFFENVLETWRFYIGYRRDLCVFSELNEKSLTLGRSLKTNDGRRLIVYTDCHDGEEENTQELLEAAKKDGAICLKKDISAVDFDKHSKKSNALFFIMGSDSEENNRQAVSLVNQYGNRSAWTLYLFSNSAESEIIMNAVQKNYMKTQRVNEPDQGNYMKVHRVNMAKSLVYRELYDNGQQLFENALGSEKGEKSISAVVIGMGSYGTEMIKALSWFCQMDGYTIDIQAFDKSVDAKSQFKALCPELMDKAHNGVKTEGEAQYNIEIHPGIDVSSYEFVKLISKIHAPTYVFVALGDDTLNMKTAVKVRELFLQRSFAPYIQAVIYSEEMKETIKDAANYSGQLYDIHATGDIASTYSEETIMKLEIEELALKRHKGYCTNEQQINDFWRYEYNYSSSMASVLHLEMRKKCQIPGADKPLKDRTEQEVINLRKLEHRRWNAYMRSEGFCYGAKRNNLAKLHPCLIPFDELPEKEKQKDDD